MTAENIFPICFLHILLLLISVWKVFMSVRPFISNHVLEKHGMLTDVYLCYTSVSGKVHCYVFGCRRCGCSWTLPRRNCTRNWFVFTLRKYLPQSIRLSCLYVCFLPCRVWWPWGSAWGRYWNKPKSQIK